jgi:hypothetical protein
MGMRLEIAFARPLSLEQQRRCLMAVAALAGARSLHFSKGGYRALIHGESLSSLVVRQVLLDEQLPLEAIADPQASGAEELPGEPQRERLRPLGR